MMGNIHIITFMLGMPCWVGIWFWLISWYTMVLAAISRVKRLTWSP